MKTFFLSMITLVALASCNKDTQLNSPEEGKSNLQFKIGVPATYNIDSPGTATNPTINSLKVELLDANGLVESRMLTPEQIQGATGATGVVLEQISDKATKVKVTANGLTPTSTAIKAYQVKFSDVPFSGEGEITYNENDKHSDGHKLKKASIEIKAEVARVEISGAIDVDEVKNGFYAVDIEKIYINNYLQNLNATDLFKGQGNTNGIWGNEKQFSDDGMTNLISTDATPATGSFYSADHNIGILKDKADVYHIFPVTAAGTTIKEIEDQLISVVLKVKVYKNAANYAAKTAEPDLNWITVKTFKNENNVINTFEGGKIYRLNLGDLTSFFKPGVTPPVDPSPNSEKADIQLNVKVLPWVLVNMTPNI